MATEPPEAVTEDHVTKERSPVEARQGVVSGRVLTVLVISLVAAVIAMAIGWWIFS